MKETRSAVIGTGDGDMTLAGTAITFSTPTTIHTPEGDFTEVIEPTALDGCDLSDCTLRVEHDERMIPLARTPGTMTLSRTDRGLEMVATLADDSQTARDAYIAVKRGDIQGMSFAFKVADGGSHYDPTTNVRTISKITKVYELSLCSNPAYTNTSVEARSQVRQGTERMAALRLAGRVRAMATISSIRS